MAFSTFPNNPFPPSTAQFNEGKNDAIQAEIDAIKDGTTIDSFGGVETALATKTNLSNIAPAFDATSGVYAIGDKVIYDGVLYEFTSAHATAGEWDENEVQPVKVSELIDTLKSGLTDVNSYKSQSNNNGYIIPVYVMSPAENDCNTFVNAGIYQCENATNAPTTGWCTIFAIPFGAVTTNYVQQICFAIASNKIYHRYRNNGTWGEWVQLHS